MTPLRRRRLHVLPPTDAGPWSRRDAGPTSPLGYSRRSTPSSVAPFVQLLVVVVVAIVVVVVADNAEASQWIPGKIGCKFSSRDLCDKSEVCLEDNLFGQCLNKELHKHPLRLDLDSDTLELLEAEISLLMQKSFTWKDGFTQCVMRGILEARMGNPVYKDLTVKDLHDNCTESKEVQKVAPQRPPPSSRDYRQELDKMLTDHGYFDDEHRRPRRSVNAGADDDAKRKKRSPGYEADSLADNGLSFLERQTRAPTDKSDDAVEFSDEPSKRSLQHNRNDGRGRARDAASGGGGDMGDFLSLLQLQKPKGSSHKEEGERGRGRTSASDRMDEMDEMDKMDKMDKMSGRDEIQGINGMDRQKHQYRQGSRTPQNQRFVDSWYPSNSDGWANYDNDDDYRDGYYDSFSDTQAARHRVPHSADRGGGRTYYAKPVDNRNSDLSEAKELLSYVRGANPQGHAIENPINQYHGVGGEEQFHELEDGADTFDYLDFPGDGGDLSTSKSGRTNLQYPDTAPQNFQNHLTSQTSESPVHPGRRPKWSGSQTSNDDDVNIPPGEISAATIALLAELSAKKMAGQNIEHETRQLSRKQLEEVVRGMRLLLGNEAPPMSSAEKLKKEDEDESKKEKSVENELLKIWEAMLTGKAYKPSGDAKETGESRVFVMGNFSDVGKSHEVRDPGGRVIGKVKAAIAVAKIFEKVKRDTDGKITGYESGIPTLEDPAGIEGGLDWLKLNDPPGGVPSLSTKPGSQELFLGDPPNLPPEGNEIYEAEMKNGKWGPIKEHLRKGGHLDKFAFVPAHMVGKGLKGEKIPLKEFELKINNGKTEAVVFGASAEAFVEGDSSSRHGGRRPYGKAPSSDKPGRGRQNNLQSERNRGRGSSKNRQNNYGYLTVNRRFKDEAEGILLLRNLADVLGISSNDFRDVNVRGPQVTFRMNEGSPLNASVAIQKAVEKKQLVTKGMGLSIIGHGLGNKTQVDMVEKHPRHSRFASLSFVLCSIGAAGVIGTLTIYAIKRHESSKAKLRRLSDSSNETEPHKDYQDLCRQRMQNQGAEKGEQLHTSAVAARQGRSTPVPTGRASPAASSIYGGSTVSGGGPMMNGAKQRNGASWSEEPVVSNMDISTGHIILAYMEDHLRNEDRLMLEWEGLCAYEADPCSTQIASRPENSATNRYADVLPYDHSRVILNNALSVNGREYINASLIFDHDPRSPAYIATQGPLQHTTADFWQMIWEQGCTVIVMLTRLVESGKHVCAQYWPEDGANVYHIYEVHLVSEHVWCDEFLVRSFYLKNLHTGETRTVTQFHFLAWRENSVPRSTKALLDFRRKVNKSYRSRACPVVVHCSEGCGRTGTYILLDMVLNRINKGAKEIDIAATLEHLRDQRMHLVRTREQFEFVLAAVAEEVHAILRAVSQ